MYVARGRFSGPGVNLSETKIVSLIAWRYIDVGDRNW